MQLYDFQKTAELLGCSRNMITKFIQDGHLTPITLPGQKRQRISQSELNKFISSLTKGDFKDPRKKENPMLKYKKSNSAQNKVA